MVPQPNAVLQNMGLTIIESASVIITLTFSHGVFILLFSITIASLLQRGLRTHLQLAMLSLAIISYASAAIGCAAWITEEVVLIQSAMVDNLEVPLHQRLVLADYKAFRPGIVMLWMINILPFFSDSFVVWRAWVVFFDNRRVIIAPLLLLHGTIATMLAYLALVSDLDRYFKTAQDSMNLTSKFYYASLAFSLATNAVATLMIGYKFWVHRTHLFRMFGRAQRITHAQNILVILIESGMCYFMLQLVIIFLALYLLPADQSGPGFIVGQVFQNIYPQLSGMYPMIIVVLVNYQRSFVDTYNLTSLDLNSLRIDGDNTSAWPATARHLSCVPPAETITELPESSNGAELGVIERDFKKVDIGKRQVKTT